MSNKARIFIIIILYLIAFYLIFLRSNSENKKVRLSIQKFTMFAKTVDNWRGLNETEVKTLSVLGRLLYLEEEPPNFKNVSGKKYKISIWKHWNILKNRHMQNFGSKTIDPFSDCSVSNCEIVHEDRDLDTADLVIFHMQHMQANLLPVKHPEGQIWAFLTDETPYHTFLKRAKLTDFNGVFNWSMTYRMDSDIPVPYGRTVTRKIPLLQETFQYNKRRDILVTALMSNCGGRNHRLDYIKELKKYIEVDFYGGCGTKKTCPGGFRKNCEDIDNYMFYLAFENSNCRDYMTEKVWWNGYEKNSIPIVMGSNKDNYKKLLPPNSYINIDDFDSPQVLANYLLYLNETGKYQDLYQWRRNFIAKSEHGYFQSRSYHLCRACEALNYNKRNVKTYHALEKFWNVNTDCYPDWKSRATNG